MLGKRNDIVVVYTTMLFKMFVHLKFGRLCLMYAGNTVGAKSLERAKSLKRSGKITHERPKKDFSLKINYLFKKYSSSSSYFSKKKSKNLKQFSVLSVEKSYSFFSALQMSEPFFLG